MVRKYSWKFIEVGVIDKSIPYEPGSDFIFEKGIMYIKVSRIGLNATLIGGFLWIEEAGV